MTSTITAFVEKIDLFDVHAPDVETQCAVILREMNRLQKKSTDNELEKHSIRFAEKIDSLPEDNPVRQKLDALFEEIIYGMDFEYKITEFAHKVEVYCQQVNNPELDTQINEIFGNLKTQAVTTDDMDVIVPLIRGCILQFDTVCQNSDLSDQLKDIFEDIFKEYDSDKKFKETAEALKRSVDVFVQRATISERMKEIKSKISEFSGKTLTDDDRIYLGNLLVEIDGIAAQIKNF